MKSWSGAWIQSPDLDNDRADFIFPHCALSVWTWERQIDLCPKSICWFSFLKLFIPLLFSSDPFADATKGDDRLPAGTEDYIHIRIQQRNGRKTLTTVQGIADDYDKKKLVKAFKKVNHLNNLLLQGP